MVESATFQAASVQAATIHASAVLADTRAILIRGPSGSGKSALAFALINAAPMGLLRFARLVADDRVALTACHGRLLARAPAALAGLIEVRGLGIRSLVHEAVAVVGLIVDLKVVPERLPTPDACEAVIAGIRLPRLAVAGGTDPFPAVLAVLQTAYACPKVGEK